MMKLTTVWALDRAIESGSRRNAMADALAAHWDHDPGSVRHFRTSANAIYRLTRHGRPAFLRIAADTERSRRHIARELDLLAWLTSQSIPVVQPIPARSGDLVVTGDSPIGTLHAVLFDGLDGWLRDLDDLAPDDAHAWGATLGRLHRTLSRAPERFRGHPAAWRDALDAAIAGTDRVPAAVRAEARRLRAVLDTLPHTSETYGPIHTDVELDNIVWNDGTVAILDFDEFGDGWFMLDIAKALTDPLHEGDTIATPRIAAFIDGYRQHHPLDDGMLQHLPDFLALSDLRTYMSLLRAVDLEAVDAEVAWLSDLVLRLRGWMARYEAGLRAGQAGDRATP